LWTSSSPSPSFSSPPPSQSSSRKHSLPTPGWPPPGLCYPLQQGSLSVVITYYSHQTAFLEGIIEWPAMGGSVNPAQGVWTRGWVPWSVLHN
jgi:hypothetical protein